ncbi:MAG: GH3 auxin-responsive promoter family protein [Candidatus Bathyarchaeia archaeon]
MLGYIFRLVKPLVDWYATGFLRERGVLERQRTLLDEKLERLCRCNIGGRLGVEPSSSFQDLPLTGYDFYLPFFDDPHDGDFIYPLDDYVRAGTSGTMGKPKTYLLPWTGFRENVRKSVLSFLYLVTHDGEGSKLEVGDTLYANIPGGNFLAAFTADAFKSNQSRFFRLVPENRDHMSFQEKVDYFIDNHQEIDIAYMTVTTFLDEICPYVDDEVYLKGFFTQDITAGPLKDEIKRRSGNYPKTIYAATETFIAGLPSIEYPGAFLFDWRTLYPEFIKESESVNSKITVIDEAPDLVPMTDVEVGGRYQLIVTPYYNDLTRYVMPDIVECISGGDDVLNTDIPVFKYYARSDKVLSLQNFTRINEEELITVLKNSGVPFVDFTARSEIDGTREYLSIYIELAHEMPEDEVYQRVNRGLLDIDRDWRDLSSFMNYTPLKVSILPRGTFKRFLHNKPGMARVTRIGMREERFNKLMDLGL